MSVFAAALFQHTHTHTQKKKPKCESNPLRVRDTQLATEAKHGKTSHLKSHTLVAHLLKIYTYKCVCFWCMQGQNSLL